jgi:hypothetical protein
VPVRELIDAAMYLNSVFERSASNSPARALLAELLIILYHEVERRLGQASLNGDALPQLTGVDWQRNSGLAGIVDDIQPFCMLDIWIVSLGHRARLPHHLRRRPVRPPPTPPPPPPPISRPAPVGNNPIPPPDTINSVIGQPEFTSVSTADYAGRGLDIIGGFLSGFSLAAEIAGAAFSGAIADILGIPISIASSLLAMPLAWAAGDRVWAYNNSGWAFCQAMYDMSFAFASEDLLRTPESQWPPIRLPLQPDYPMGTLARDEIARRALREGNELAVSTIRRLDEHPDVKQFMLHGQTISLAISGRRLLVFLNMLARRNHERVLDYLRRLVERRSGQSMAVMRW